MLYCPRFQLQKWKFFLAVCSSLRDFNEAFLAHLTLARGAEVGLCTAPQCCKSCVNDLWKVSEFKTETGNCLWFILPPETYFRFILKSDAWTCPETCLKPFWQFHSTNKWNPVPGNISWCLLIYCYRFSFCHSYDELSGKKNILVLLLLFIENNRDGSYIDQQGASHNVHG